MIDDFIILPGCEREILVKHFLDNDRRRARQRRL